MVLTRHAVDLGSGPPSEAWLRERRARLATCAAVSLAHQTEQRFEWLILVDSAIAQREEEILADLFGEINPFTVAPTVGAFQPGPLASSQLVLPPLAAGTVVITTRLDSDDALASRFIEIVRSHALESFQGRPLSIDLVRGAFIDVSDGVPVARKYWASPFQSLVERQRVDVPLLTVFAEPHPKLPSLVRYLPIVTNEPQWFVGVHSGNLANRAVGIPMPADVIPPYLRWALGVPAQLSPVTRLRKALSITTEVCREIPQRRDLGRRFRRAWLSLIQ